jgi:hypothetical protein
MYCIARQYFPEDMVFKGQKKLIRQSANSKVGKGRGDWRK